MRTAVVDQPARQIAESTAGERHLPLDALRRLIMIAMALDHASYFIAHIHTRGEFWDSFLLTMRTRLRSSRAS